MYSISITTNYKVVTSYTNYCNFQIISESTYILVQPIWRQIHQHDS